MNVYQHFSLIAALVATCCAVGLTLVSYRMIRMNRYRLLCGMLVNITIMSYLTSIALWAIQINQPWATNGLMSLLLVLLIPVTLVGTFSAFLFIWNGIVVWRRESHSLGNLLTLIIGLLLVVIPAVFSWFDAYLPKNQIIRYIQNVAASFQDYLVFWVLSFITSYIITKWLKPKWDKDYIIVLGAGLIDGHIVSPLLGSRILVAKHFKDAQFKRNQRRAILIMSGGKGSDERLSEAEAMKAYAIQAGVPAGDILVETRSKNTYQNMLFSKTIAEEHGFALDKGLFATNDYHVFRAAGFARLVGLTIDGLGSKTSHYFLPNALIREYIAILLRHKVFHFTAVVVMLMANAIIFFE